MLIIYYNIREHTDIQLTDCQSFENNSTKYIEIPIRTIIKSGVGAIDPPHMA